jgi:ABC-2 type transport system ATP-binding protein
MEPIIELKNLKKTFKVLNRHEGLKGSIRDLFSRDYKYVNAVDDISAKIYPGEIVGYLGPNGAGKSTTIKMMTGILEPSDGVIVVNGLVPYKNRTLNAQNIGVVFGQRTQLWWALPVIESFKILKEIYNIDTKTYNENLELFDSIVNISSLYMKPVRQMSLGQRTLCDIVASFLHNPKIVFLDEPTIGLDVSMKSKIRDIVKKINEIKGTTIILTTHDIGDVEALCKRAVIIDKGKMVYDNDFSQLKNKFGKYRTLKIEKGKPKDNERILLTVNEINNACNAINIIEHEDETENEWIELLINEDIITLTDVLNKCMKAVMINDVKIEEIRTEDIIKKIYEGDADEN